MAYEQFTRLNKKAYPIIGSSPEEALADAEHIIPQGNFDFIFFDLPGTVNGKGVISTLLNVDYIFSPISADRVVLESTLDYLIALREQIETIGKSYIKGTYLLWNLVDGREKSELYDVYEAVIKELGFVQPRSIISRSRILCVRCDAKKAHTLFPISGGFRRRRTWNWRGRQAQAHRLFTSSLIARRSGVSGKPDTALSVYRNHSATQRTAKP